MYGLITLIKNDICAQIRQGHSWLTPVFFYIMVVTFIPLSLGTDKDLLNKLAPGIIWVALILAVLLSIGSIFKQDHYEGNLELLILSPYPLPILILCKIISHWLVNCVPLIIISPLLGYLLQLPSEQQVVLLMTLLLGTPTLSLIGGIGSALIVGIRGSGLLLPILMMPLYIPVLIFGTGTVIASSQHQMLSGYFAMMGALLLLSLAFGPLLTAVSLRIGVNQ